ncbi:hypothetical protein [Acetilactobacillus jinshanensis]|uniref:hypothetical protein n=1 Tax=Acetilactobacillus jinshanensis TaxID=1720083 RepID=UPI0013A5F608|nr:hypothetical protein [Acetilactobacillus jinshanensis]URL61573.1 hypothetical protein HGK75_06205 [uncultured bacterium]
MNKEQLQKLAIQANVRRNGMDKNDNDDYSVLSFAIFIVLVSLFVSFICLMINL